MRDEDLGVRNWGSESLRDSVACKSYDATNTMKLHPLTLSRSWQGAAQDPRTFNRRHLHLFFCVLPASPSPSLLLTLPSFSPSLYTKRDQTPELVVGDEQLLKLGVGFVYRLSARGMPPLLQYGFVHM